MVKVPAWRKALDKKADSLISKYRLNPTRGTGSFGTGASSLHRLEYLMHELAHMLTLGVFDMPMNEPLSDANDKALLKLGVATRDSLEIDTSYVVFKAGAQMGLWANNLVSEEARMIANSCVGNLDGEERISVWHVLTEFEKRSGDSIIQDATENLLNLLDFGRCK